MIARGTVARRTNLVPTLVGTSQPLGTGEGLEIEISCQWRMIQSVMTVE